MIFIMQHTILYYVLFIFLYVHAKHPNNPIQNPNNFALDKYKRGNISLGQRRTAMK